MSEKDDFSGFGSNESTGAQSHEDGSPVANDPWGASSPGATPAPDLDQNLPSLSGSTSQKLNKKGLFFLAAIAVVGFSLAAVAYKRMFTGGSQAEQPVKEEQVVVPDKPEPPRLLADSSATAALPQDLPTLPDMSASMPTIEASQPQAMGQSALTAVPGSSLFNRDGGGSKPITLAERRAAQSGSVINGGGSGVNVAGGGADLPAGAAGGLLGGGGDGAANAVKASNVRKLRNPDSLLVRGTYIRCALETKLVSDVAGYTSCIVTDPIYSVNGRKLLIERGSRISGVYREEDRGVYDRAGVLWERVLTPSGRDIQLGSPGIDMLGGAGHPGQYDAHWGQKLGAAILVSMAADVFNIATVKYGPTVSTTTVDGTTGAVTTTNQKIDSKTAEALSKMPDQILAKTINRPATVTVNQGTILNIYTSRDIDFSSVLD